MIVENINIITQILTFFLGASIASFICVFADSEILNKRSKCLNCEKQLNWYELIPIISYVLQLGKCRNLSCKSKIPAKLLFAEILLGIWFVFSFNFFLNTNTFFLISSLCFGSLLFYLSYQDFKKNEVSANSLYLLFSFSVLFFAYILLLNFKSTNIFSLQNILTISVSLIFLYFSLYGKDKHLGQGDYFIFASILLFFGMENFINILVYSVWIGSFISIVYMYKKFGKYKREVQVPFIPFLFLGTLFFHITQYKVFIIKDILEIIKFLTN